MSKPLIWMPKIQEDIYEVIESAVNNTMSKDPLLFLTYPDLGLLEFSADKQRCILYVENTKILFTYYYYSNSYYRKRFTIAFESNGTKRYPKFERFKVSLDDKILHDLFNIIGPCEKDIPQCKELEVLYKLKLIGVKQ